MAMCLARVDVSVRVAPRMITKHKMTTCNVRRVTRARNKRHDKHASLDGDKKRCLSTDLLTKWIASLKP